MNCWNSLDGRWNFAKKFDSLKKESYTNYISYFVKIVHKENNL